MQSPETSRGLFEDTLAVAGRQLLAFVVGAIAGAMYGGLVGWAVAAAAVAMAIVPAGYFKDLWNDRSNHRAIVSGLVQIVVTSAALAALSFATLGWEPSSTTGVGAGTVMMCAYGIMASAAVQSAAALIALACLMLGVGLPDFIDD